MGIKFEKLILSYASLNNFLNFSIVVAVQFWSINGISFIGEVVFPIEEMPGSYVDT